MPRQEFITTDLQKPIRLQELKTDLFLNDNKGNVITVVVTDGGVDYAIDGDVVCYMIRPDTSTLTIQGTSDDNQAIVELPENAYLYPGRASFVIKAESETSKVTLAAFTAIIYRDRSDRIVDNDRVIPSLDEIMAIVNQINDMTVSVITYPAGSNATAVLRTENNHYALQLGIPRGVNGSQPRISYATLLAANWSSDEAPTQTVSVYGMGDNAIVLVSVASGATQMQYEQACLARIVCTGQSVGSMTFTCYGAVPTLAIPVIVVNLSESAPATE